MSCIDQLSDEELDDLTDAELDQFLSDCAEAQDPDDSHYREPGTTWDDPEEDE